jgi:hypothetical protein
MSTQIAFFVFFVLGVGGGGYIPVLSDRLCGLVVRLPGCRLRGPGFDYRSYQIF